MPLRPFSRLKATEKAFGMSNLRSRFAIILLCDRNIDPSPYLDRIFTFFPTHTSGQVIQG